MKRFLVVVAFMMVATCVHAAAKSDINRPYVAIMDGLSRFYARCIPDLKNNKMGSEGITQILRIQAEGDQVIATYAWYNRHGLVMGWSPIAGKVAVMRLRQEQGLATEKQIEFSFYLGDQFLRSYTTADIIKLGGKLERDEWAFEDGLGASSKRAAYHVEGCKQVWNTNDYYFSIRLSESQTLSFNILTGKVCQVEKDGDRERLVIVDKAPPGDDVKNQAVVEFAGEDAKEGLVRSVGGIRINFPDSEKLNWIPAKDADAIDPKLIALGRANARPAITEKYAPVVDRYATIGDYVLLSGHYDPPFPDGSFGWVVNKKDMKYVGHFFDKDSR
jgi:hypothetical protein